MTDYVLSPKARSDLEEIWLYSLREWGVRQADAYVAEIFRVIQGVASGDIRTRPADDIRPGLKRVRSGRHVVFFRETETALVVVRLLHGRMDVGRWL